jgi:hypothetical protein
MKESPNTDSRDTLTLSQGPARLPIIIEARQDRVLVVCGPYGGTGRTVGEAMDALARRMGRATAPGDGLTANHDDRATDEA